ncbi:MAG: hypothetical protein Q8K37_02005, partial [Alphaproteobacteria bacterium]|nr:hypothetical protein [Alphaproteobacteria bacterium]
MKKMKKILLRFDATKEIGMGHAMRVQSLIEALKNKIDIDLVICGEGEGIKKVFKNIDLYPQSNLNTGTYYSNYEEVKAGLTGCYNGLQSPLFNEWQFTELRSDNSKMGAPGSTASA